MASKKATYEDLAAAFKQGNFRPMYLLYGEERYFIESLQALLLENALEEPEKDFNLDIIYGAEANVQNVLSICASYPLMAQRRVVIVRDFDRLKENRRFADYAKQPNPSTVVFLVCGRRPKMSAHPYLAINKHGVVAEFKALYSNQMPSWIERAARDRGFSIEPNAIQMLTEFVGCNLQNAVTELEKLSTYVGDRKTLTADDVVQASGQTREFNVFELQRAIGERRHNDAIRVTERLLQQSSNRRQESSRIIAVLTSYFIKLWKLASAQRPTDRSSEKRRISEKEMSSSIGVSPFFLKEYLMCLRRFDEKALKRAFSALLAADYELKGGSSRSERLILNLMLRRMLTPVANTTA